jgi:S1-C subfamily serine protease
VIPTGEGTGFIVDGDGTVLTNFHVIDGADKVRVTLIDGTVVDAKVVGSDASSDIAVLHADIPADRAVVATLGDSDAVQPGQLAVAIGTPFGLDHTITAGIVSAVGREFGTTPGGRPARNLIQTDAPINPGNSGGPLFNAAGEVIGVTTSIESPVRGSVGIGFAVPVNRARAVLAQVRAGKSADPAWLGVAVGTLTPSLASSLGVPSSVSAGLVLSQVVAGGPAAKAGMRGSTAEDGTPQGDVIVAVDGNAIRRTTDLTSYLDRRAPGDVVTVTFYRDGKRSDVKVTLGAWPQASS